MGAFENAFSQLPPMPPMPVVPLSLPGQIFSQMPPFTCLTARSHAPANGLLMVGVLTVQVPEQLTVPGWALAAGAAARLMAAAAMMAAAILFMLCTFPGWVQLVYPVQGMYATVCVL
ncbi:hypothetical protein J4T99_gp113 [Mycobacterium phage Bromden]|uniref:Uncharacterized protein n=1 Tax=Mycobacterium phage Bromden TaxID=2283252 RepID=A0A345MBP8_9CAUD|nr:hypothetical protein J4T99_gp113 [Mycobacterium phage Bromden]AXH67919.1 hypothetical protein SEA_BROMDEN_127 [Mycobacterium phage Bromden]